MSLPRPAGPARLAADVRDFFATRQKHQLLFAAMSVLLAAGLVTAFYFQARPKPRVAEIVFVESWPSTRSDKEVIAERDRLHVERAEAIKQRQAAFKRLHDQIGWLH